MPNDRKTLTFTRCDCLSVCLCLISLPLLVGSSTARQQIDSAGCKQRGLIGVVSICLFNPPSNQAVFFQKKSIFYCLFKRYLRETKIKKEAKRKEKRKHSLRGCYSIPLFMSWEHVNCTDALCSREWQNILLKSFRLRRMLLLLLQFINNCRRKCSGLSPCPLCLLEPCTRGKIC